jgi:hypothetical protein
VPSDPPLDRLRSQLSAQEPATIQGAVTIKTSGTAYGERTVVRIDHRLPELGRGGRAAFRITTRQHTKRGGYVDMDAANRPDVIAVLRQLGFRDAPRVSGFSPSGRHLRQDATG